MTLEITPPELLALALLEIRQLLASELGAGIPSETATHIRHAAHLAYAIHNEALAVLAGDSFNARDALERLSQADSLFGAEGFTASVLNDFRAKSET